MERGVGVRREVNERIAADNQNPDNDITGQLSPGQDAGASGTFPALNNFGSTSRGH